MQTVIPEPDARFKKHSEECENLFGNRISKESSLLAPTTVFFLTNSLSQAKDALVLGVGIAVRP